MPTPNTQRTYDRLVRGPIRDGHLGLGYELPGRHLHTDRTIGWALGFMLEGLGFTQGAINLMWQDILRAVRDNPDEAAAARVIYNILEAHQPGRNMDRMQKSLRERTQRMVRQVGPHIQVDSLLDYGCGDGLITLELEAARDPTGYRRIACYDVNDFRAPEVRNHRKIKFIDQHAIVGDAKLDSFDAAMALTVLHHCEDPALELSVMRGNAHRLVILESIISPLLPLQTQAWIDWFWNRCLYPDANIPVPGNWLTPYEWDEVFDSLDLNTVHREDLGIDQPTGPEHHMLWVLEPR